MRTKKTSANLASLLTLPCRIAKLGCVPPHNEEGIPLDPHELSTTGSKLIKPVFDTWSCEVMYDIIINNTIDKRTV